MEPNMSKKSWASVAAKPEDITDNDVDVVVERTTVRRHHTTAENGKSTGFRKKLVERGVKKENLREISKLLFEAEKNFDDNPQIAKKKLMKVLSIDENCFEANFMMANLLMEMESYVSAQGYYLKAMESNQELPKLYYNYGVLMANYCDEPDIALQSYHKAVSIQKDFPHAWYNMGNIYAREAELEDFPQARQCYENCIQQSPSAIPEAYYNLGRILLSEFDEPKDKLKAKHCFKTVIQLRPKYESAIYHYGKLFQDFLGDNEMAKVQFKKVLKLNPNHWRAQQRLRIIKQDEIEAANSGKQFADPEIEKSKSLILGKKEFDEETRKSVKTTKKM